MKIVYTLRIYTFNDEFSNTSLPFFPIPYQVVEIGTYAFYMCFNPTKIYFQSGSKLIEINDFAFSNSSLKEISIPSKVKILGDNVFGCCKNN